jgi:radical SAM superfamily enzyme YgiQ (UPF0313 family)
MNKKSIALVFPKTTFLEYKMSFQPLGLMYLGAQLEAQGHKVDFLDLNEDELPKDGDYDQLWVSTTSPQIFETKRIAQVTDGWTKTKRILGGAGPWANPDTHKEIPYDLVFGGECDHPDTVRRIVEMTESFKPERYTLFPVNKNLNWVIPPLHRYAERYKAYMTDLNTDIRHRMISITSSRGCMMNCAFCEVGRHGVIFGMVRYEPLSIVEQQIKNCVDAGWTGIAYYDDVFPIQKPRTLAIMELHKKYNIKFRCFLRTDIIMKYGGYEYLKQMRDGGLIEIFVGVESADNQIKDNIDKGTTIEQDTQVLEWCRQLGITYKASFILGLPGENKDSLEKTRNWILAQNPHGMRIQVGRLIPFKGTPLGDHPEKFDIHYDELPDDDWFYSGNMEDMHSFVSTASLTRDEIDIEWRDLLKQMKERGFRN